MRRKNIFLAAVLSAAMVSSSVTPAFAESLTDGETAAMETAEETETETEPMEEAPETEQEPVITEVPEELPMEEIEELPMEEADELLQEEPGKLENETDVLLEAPEVTEENSGTEEYTKELIAQTSAPAETAANSSSYSVKAPKMLYYNAFELYDEYNQFMGIEIDQYTSKNASWQTHWLTYVWYYDEDNWEVYEYSEEEKDLTEIYLEGTEYHNIWGDMDWLLHAFQGKGYAATDYHLDTSKATWDYTYTTYDVRKEFYTGACADLSKHAGLRPINGNTYYLMKDGTMVRNKKMTVNGKVYLFGKDCKCYKSYVPVEAKWIKKPDGYYWQQDDGTILREGGWQTLGGSKYFLAYKSGRRKTGWQTWKGNKYYMAPATGRLVTGLKTIEGNTYFLQYKTGEMVKGWKTIGKDKYYFNEQTGIMKRGMLTLNGKKYYFDKGGNRDGKQHFGWRSISGKAYFFDRKTGVMKQNTWIIDGKDKYYANKNGSRFSGIRSIKGKNYYFHTDGKLVTNKKGYKINGKKYNIDKNGVLTLVK